MILPNIKTKENFENLIVSPIFYNDKYSINKILNAIKFNLLTLNWKKRKYALGGINLNNLRKKKHINHNDNNEESSFILKLLFIILRIATCEPIFSLIYPSNK